MYTIKSNNVRNNSINSIRCSFYIILKTFKININPLLAEDSITKLGFLKAGKSIIHGDAPGAGKTFSAFLFLNIVKNKVILN